MPRARGCDDPKRGNANEVALRARRDAVIGTPGARTRRRDGREGRDVAVDEMSTEAGEREPAPRAGRAGRVGVLRAWRWPVALAILVAAGWLLRDLDFAHLAATLRGATWGLVALAAGLNLTLNVTARTLRWRALLPKAPSTGRAVGFAALARLVLASIATNNVLPFRVGEAVRAVGLRDTAGYPMRIVVASQVAEKMVEGAAMATASLPLVLSPGSARTVVLRAFVLVMGALALGALVVAGLRSGARWHREDGVLRRFVRQARQVVGTLDRPRSWLQSFGWALVSDGVDLATIALCAAAVKLHLGPLGWCAVLVGVNVAIAVPTTPAQVGVLEAGAVLVLAGLGVEHDRALAFALLYHGVHVVPFTLAGGVALALPAHRPRARHEPPPSGVA